jgi:hypothetical protein
MYQHEQPTPALLEQHINEMDATLQLIDQMLNQTPYQPGASWVTQLPLDGEKAERSRASAEKRASASLVRRRLRRARAVDPEIGPGLVPACPRTGVPTVPGVPTPALPGVASPEVPQAPPLPTTPPAFPATSRSVRRWRPRARCAQTTERARRRGAAGSAARAAIAARTQQARIVEDALTTTSVAIRLTAEAMALATVIVLESASLAGPALVAVVDRRAGRRTLGRRLAESRAQHLWPPRK